MKPLIFQAVDWFVTDFDDEDNDLTNLQVAYNEEFGSGYTGGFGDSKKTYHSVFTFILFVTVFLGVY